MSQMPQDISLADLCQRYLGLYTACIGDVLDDMGYRCQILPHEIQAIGAGMRIAGPAFTIKGLPDPRMPSADDSERGLIIVEKIAPLSVLVRDTSGDKSCAHWGELMSNTVKSRGCQGAVIGGGVRDTAKIQQIGFPVFAMYRTPADMNGRWRILDGQIPIRIGVTVINPEDFVIGDEDGVVIVPMGVVREVLVEAEARVQKENAIRDELRKGASPVEMRRKYGGF